MKKVFAFLLAIMLLTSVACAWAEGTTEETTEEAVEITFQDIPWGSSKEEVKSWAKENGFQTVTDKGSYSSVFLDASGKYICDSAIYVNLSGDDKILFAQDNASFQIAGYMIDGLDFHFDVQNENPELCTVVVRFQSSVLVSSLDTYEQAKEQAQVILDDLEQKLLTVYGENAVPSTDDSPFGFGVYLSGGYTSNRYQKVGAENTAICLTKTVMDGVMLIYGKTDVYVAEETNVVPLTIDSFNFDGL